MIRTLFQYHELHIYYPSVHIKLRILYNKKIKPCELLASSDQTMQVDLRYKQIFQYLCTCLNKKKILMLTLPTLSISNLILKQVSVFVKLVINSVGKNFTFQQIPVLVLWLMKVQDQDIWDDLFMQNVKESHSVVKHVNQHS